MPIQGPALVIDTADWDLVVPISPAADLAGSRLTAALTPGLGGATIVSVSSDDGSIAWDADPVTGLTDVLRITVPFSARGEWRAVKATPVGADVHRFPPGSTRNEWLGGTNFTVLPASDSLPAQSMGFLYGGGRYPNGRPGGQALLPALQVGPQGAQGLPGRDGGTHTTVIVQGQPAAVWTLSHGLGRFPSVTLVDTAGDRFEADTQYLDANTILVTLGFPTAGTAYLN